MCTYYQSLTKMHRNTEISMTNSSDTEHPTPAELTETSVQFTAV